MQSSESLAKETQHDMILGCLFGSALGDAVGLYTEFLSASMSLLAYPSQQFVLYPACNATAFRKDAHRNPHQPGEWTDDTDHALLILLSCMREDCKLLDPHDFASRLVAWVQHGLIALGTLPLGLGRTVGSIVRTEGYLNDPEGTAWDHWENSEFQVAPNGSLMRTYPLGILCMNKTLTETFGTAAAYSVVTHVDPRCIISCAIGTGLIRGLINQELNTEDDIDNVIEKALSWWRAYRVRCLADTKRRGEPDLDLGELRRHAKIVNLDVLELDDGYSIGYVYKTFGCGVHLLRMAMRKLAASGRAAQASAETLFDPLITDLIMRGGDADTNACFAGALIGTYVGYKALPPHWRDGLRHGPWLLHKAEGLSQLLGVTEGTYRGSEDAENAIDGGRGFPTDEEMDARVARLKAEMDSRAM